LLESHKAEILARIPRGSHIRIISADDPEALQYAKEICNWLQSLGYYKASGVDQLMPFPISGQEIGKLNDSTYQILIGKRI